MYAQVAAPYRNKKDIKVCEIGVDTGGSMNFWLSFFSNAASVDGIRFGRKDEDLHPCESGGSPENCHKLKIIDADQSKSSDLRRFIKEALGTEEYQYQYPANLSDKEGWKKTGWDFVVDDGSHVPVHMLLTFKMLWPYVRPGGMYVIEDNGFSYTDTPAKVYGYKIDSGGIGKPPPGNLVEKFKQVADLTLRDWTHPVSNEDMDYTVFTPEIDKTIYSVQFIAGCIIVQKKTAGQELIAKNVVPVAKRSTMFKFRGGSFKAWKEKLQSEDRNWDAGA
jgi:hypothetical protein